MFQTGWCTLPESTWPGDGLELRAAVITAAVHCAPPQNKPTTEEIAACAPWLDDLMGHLPRWKVTLCLGRLALAATLGAYARRGWKMNGGNGAFKHGARIDPAHTASVDPGAGRPRIILCSYHPSQQNTFTGRLTMEMLIKVFEIARSLAEET